MVRLDRIYTGGGDGGETSQGDGTRVSKLHPRISAGGAVDELNCVLGVAATGLTDREVSDVVRRLQQLLFDLGADLCVPILEDESDRRKSFRMTPQHVLELEKLIDHFNATLQPLNSFILPGGSAAAGWLHLARAVCRRAEVEVLRLQTLESINNSILICLNRLSDLLFVLARYVNSRGTDDVLWRPNAFLVPE